MLLYFQQNGWPKIIKSVMQHFTLLLYKLLLIFTKLGHFDKANFDLYSAKSMHLNIFLDVFSYNFLLLPMKFVVNALMTFLASQGIEPETL